MVINLGVNIWSTLKFNQTLVVNKHQHPDFEMYPQTHTLTHKWRHLKENENQQRKWQEITSEKQEHEAFLWT